ncbi:hypothetical protein [Paenibacillus elgii]|uniref:hypothetical protein n=1 Tax=Paenibacillus elgii TaxID=189691 RepID=UPI000A8B8F53|nr:hypothetical protein [Paenibacillus elgii]
MKQRLSHLDLSLIYDDDQRLLASDLGCPADQLLETISIGNLIDVIRKYHQMTFYTVDSMWCIQLFDHDVAANDQIDCIYENNREELIILLYVALEWVYDRLRGGTN